MRQSGSGRWKFRRVISHWFSRPPEAANDPSCVRHMVIDGTYVEKRTGLIAVMDADRKEAVAGAYGVSEGSIRLRLFLESLRTRHLRPASVTLDGHPGLLRAVRFVWPDIVVQRCLVHVQRQGLMWCRAKPKRADARALRGLFLLVGQVKTMADRDAFVAGWRNWEARYGRKIAVTPERGWVVSDLIRARSMVLRALPDMFRFLDDPGIPRSTNMIESYFSRLHGLYQKHRGLSKRNRDVYFRWHFHLNRK
jgi:hypothetical protein